MYMHLQNQRRAIKQMTWMKGIFSCRYCGSQAGKARKDELSTEECINVAGQLAALGCRRVSMIGGEVFMRQDWKDIAKSLADRRGALKGQWKQWMYWPALE